jgi:hypothetical protein
MPDGVVQWFDPASGDAAIVRGGKVFRAAASDLEPVARHPGVRVHFDIHRDDGVERAVDVTLRPGTRVSHRHRRFSTLVGARRADTKGTAPFAHAHPELGLSVASHPLEVAHAWARCMQAADLDTAMLLYSPDARIHTGTETLAGRSHVKGYLEASSMLGVEEEADIHGEDGTVIVTWERGGAAHRRVELRCRIEHGQIAEQWIRPAMPPRHTVMVPTGEHGFDLQVATKGDVAPESISYAVTRLGASAREVTEPILFARLKLEQAADPARDRPALAQVSLDIDGQLVRAHVAGHEMREAVDLLQQRLRDKLEHRAEHRKAVRNRDAIPQPGEWRHGDVPTDRPEHFDRPADERELIRHKSYTAGELTPDEAAFDMEQLDFDFYLFRDLATGEDALIERDADDTYRLTHLHAAAADPGPTAVPVSFTELPAPELTVRQAIDRLNADGGQRLFFINVATGRGNVLYLRYDGHYGLVTPD